MIHIFRKSLEIASQPGKLVSRPLQKIFHHHYAEKRFARTLFVVDIVVLVSIAVSVGLILAFTVFRPAKIVNLVHVDATVAPSDVVSGGLSTLIFRYENTSSEELRFARLNLGFPAHFEQTEAPADLTEVAPQTYDLGSIAPGANGSIKLSGVMFGDVGGDQVFQSTLSFVYGPNDRTATKFSEHVFHPSHSTLALELTLPDRVVQGQQAQGKITYKNTGTVDFPQIQIEPIWPEGFVLVSSSPALLAEGNSFILNGLQAGQEGTISFVGQMPPTESVDFIFNPSFTFGDDYYTQDRLTQNVKLLPSQIKTTTTFSPETITPGGTMVVTVAYEHIGELPINDLAININTLNQPLFQKPSYEVLQTVTAVQPGDIGSASITVRFNSSIDARTVSTYQQLSALVKTYVNYTLTQDDLPPAQISLLGASDSLNITSPVVLESFGRYASPQGDQLGRGPLPPLVGEETKYWVFMTIRGTTNDLENLKMDADLGPGVTFTGKQSVSYGESLNYNTTDHSITWTIGSLPPTLAPGSQMVSVAFEVAITPTADMIGKTPTLLASPLVSARDTFTGTFVSARGSTITTNLPYDSMAAGLGVVEE